MNPARFAVRQPLLVNLLTVVALVAGGMTLTEMSRESYPTVPTGWARVTTVFVGASAEEIERLVTARVEDAVAELEGVERVASYSSENVSVVLIELDPSMEEDEVARAVATVSSEIARLRGLPAGAETPIVERDVVTFPTLTVAVRGDVPEAVLQATGRHLERRLRRVSGVSDIEAAGLSHRQLRVEVDPERLRSAEMRLGEVAQRIVERATNLSAGTIDDGERTRIVRGVLAANDARTLGDVVVRPDAAGASVRLRHVADVTERYADDGVAARVNGERAVLLSLHRRGGSDAIRISERVHRLLERETETLPEGVSVLTFNDASRQVARTSEVLVENAVTGLLLVLLTLGLFMGLRNATLAALGIPVALAGGVVVMHLMGISLNILSLGAMILCAGIVVDDAIVLVDNIYRHMEEGASRKDAAIRGTREVMWPIISATATTCAAFLPLLLMTGVLGEFFAIIPKVVVAMLVASLIEALFVLPSHMADFGGRPRPKPPVAEEAPRGLSARMSRVGAAFAARYLTTLRACLRFSRTTVVMAFLVFAMLLGGALAVKEVILLPKSDVDVFDVRVRMPADTSVQETDRVLEEIERRVLALSTDDVEAVWTTRGHSRNDLGPVDEDYVGMTSVSLVPLEARSSAHAGRDLLARASGQFDDLVGPTQIQVVEYAFGPPVGAPVVVRVAGDDHARIAAIANEVVAELRQVPGVRDIENSDAADKRELRVEVDEDRAALSGLTPAAVGSWLRLAFSEAPIATTFSRNEQVDIVFGLPRTAYSEQDLSGLTLLAPDGTHVTLGDIAAVEEARVPTHIRRNDRRRGVRVTADVDPTTTSQAANRALSARLAPLIAANPDVSVTLRGEYQETNESVRSLILAFVLAAFLIFSILAAQFRSLLQPFIVLCAIPLSLIGVIVGWFVTDSPIGLIALIGVVGLAGIAVNDAIVLVDFINVRRREGAPLDEAIVEACRVRLRPVLSTSLTTVGGILPLALAGADAPLLSPMAAVIAWGLTVSTFLTLLVVPCLYRVLMGVSDALSRSLGPSWRRATGAAPGTPDGGGDGAIP